MEECISSTDAGQAEMEELLHHASDHPLQDGTWLTEKCQYIIVEVALDAALNC